MHELITRPFEDWESGVIDALNMVSSGVTDPEAWLIDALAGPSTSGSGVRVTPYSALGSPVVWNSVNLIAGHIASMPIEVHRRVRSGGSEVVTNHPAHRVLNLKCNDLQTPFTLKQQMMAHALLQGNGRCWINRNSLAQPLELILMVPENTYTVMVDGAKWHCCWFENEELGINGTLPPERYMTQGSFTGTRGTGALYKIPDEDVFHVPGLGWNGLWGFQLTTIAKEQFGLETAGTESVSYAFRNSGRPGLLLTAPSGMFRTEKQAAEFMAQFRNAHEGFDKTGRTGLLREGMGATTLDAANLDRGLADIRVLSQEQISLLFGTEYLLGQKSAVYKDLPDRMTAYVVNTLNRWMELVEQEARRKLLTPRQQQADSHFIKCNASSLLRGSPTHLAEFTGKLREQGTINGNEAREMHGLNPVPGLDSYDNPNISASESEGEATAPEMPALPAPSDQTNNRATVHLFRELLDYEKRRVIAATQGTGNFLYKTDQFYKAFQRKLEDTCMELGLDFELAETHCEESQGQLLELTAVVDQTGLTDAITGLVEDWESRAERFLENV